MIARFGGVPHVSPSMREVPLAESREAIDFAHHVITGGIDVMIFLTGVGFKHLLATVEKHVDRDRFLNSLRDMVTIVRGPKPLAAMREVGLTPTHRVPEPNTWRELLATIDGGITVANQNVGVQEYGITNRSLIAGLEARGVRVHEQLAAQLVAGGVEAPGVHARGVAVAEVDPGHHEAAVALERHLGDHRDGAVAHRELRAHARAGRVEALALRHEVVLVAPDDDEAAVGAAGHHGNELVAGGGAVDPHLATRRGLGLKTRMAAAAGVDTAAASSIATHSASTSS